VRQYGQLAILATAWLLVCSLSICCCPSPLHHWIVIVCRHYCSF